MEEKHFNDIRRNYIISSIFFILFLIYWWRIEIEQILIFKFSWDNWSIISPFWDIFVLLFIFWIYSFVRYLIYWNELIKNSSYRLLILSEILDEIIIHGWQKISENEFIKSWKISSLQSNSKNKEAQITSLQVTNLNDRKRINISATYKTCIMDNWDIKENYNFWTNINFEKISNLSISEDKIEFIYIELPISWYKKIELLFNADTFRNHFPKTRFTILLRKDFSDFIWPLWLSVVIILLFLVHFLYIFSPLSYNTILLLFKTYVNFTC